MFIPLGVDTIQTLVDLPDEIVGYTELKKSSATFCGTNANSSRNSMLYEPPRTALDDVDDATTREPFSKSTEPLFHDTTPCCNHLGRFSYASCRRDRISLAVAALFARIATFIFALNRT